MSSKAIGRIALGAAIIGGAFLTGGATILPSIAATSAGTAAIGAALSTTALGSLALAAGTAVALSGVSEATARKPVTQLAQLDRLNASLVPDTRRPDVLGRTAMATDIRYVEPSGANQEYIDYIIGVGAHRANSIDELWFEDLLAWSAKGGVQGKYAGYLTVQTRLEGSAANTIAINGGTKWGATRRLTGCAYLHLRIKRTGNGKKAESPFAGGLPGRVTIIGEGRPFYDPRLDDTVPGGSGPMRVDDQATWAFRVADREIGRNAALAVLNRLLGWRINGLVSVGMGVPARRIDMASFIVAANLCDEAVLRADGTARPRFRLDGLFTEGEDPPTVLNNCTAACNGRLRDGGGRLSLVIMHNDLATAALDDGLGDDDMISAFAWNPDAALEQSYNIVRGRYTDPSSASLYQLVPWGEIRAFDFADGIDRILTVDLPQTQEAATAQRIGKQALQRKQYQRSLSATWNARGWRYQVGDVVPVTLAALGMTRRLFRVAEQTMTMDGTCPMVLVEENAAIYAWDREDSPAVRAAEPIVYDSRNNPLILAIDRAATTAEWTSIVDTDGSKPLPYADVTRDVLDQGRFLLATASARIGTETRSRFDPLFWTVNFPNTMMAALRASPGRIEVDAVFHRKDHLVGVIWESADRFDHPTTAYDTRTDYRGCVLRFRVQLRGDVLDLEAIDGPVLTIEGRDAGGAARTWYVRLGNAAVSGTARDAVVEIDFDHLKAGFYGTSSAYAGDIDRMFISLAPAGYTGGDARLAGPVEGGMILSEIVVTGTNATLTCGLGPGGVHEVRMSNGYDDSYNVAPARILRNLRLLGYRGSFNHYVGMSHYFRWDWNAGEGRFVAQDVDQPLNAPCAAWHADLAALLKAERITLILSLSYEMLDAFMPAGFRQLDADGAPALTGWSPPSSLFSPCNSAGMAYLARVAKQFCAIAAAAGQPVQFQVGEPWYWVDPQTQIPCFYDPATTAAYLAETGRQAPVIRTMAGAMDAERTLYLDWLGAKLAASVLALVAGVRAEHSAMVSHALLYLPQILDSRMPELQRVNMPVGLAYPALDILQVEDYDFVIDGRPDLSASGRAAIERRLGYPRSKQHYFGGFALHRDSGTIWRSTTNAMQAAYDHGVGTLFVWAYTQILRDGYVPLLKIAPPLALADLLGVDLNGAQPADGDVLVWRSNPGRWVLGRPQ